MDEPELLDELTDELEKYKQETKYRKLTRSEWETLNEQMQVTPEIIDGYEEIYPSGEHYRLNMLLKTMGFYPETRHEIMDTAWSLLINGHQ